MYMLSFLLANNNYKVFQAFNGTEGLQLAEDKNPEIILMDIQLPDMDGYHVCKKIRANKHHQNSIIIAVTSYAMGGDRERAIRSGANGYIEKPINPETFIQQMETIYNEQRP